MSRKDKHEYECEDCGGIFNIIPDTDENIKYCPQCGNSGSNFKSTVHLIEHEREDYLFYD